MAGDAGVVHVLMHAWNAAGIKSDPRRRDGCRAAGPPDAVRSRMRAVRCRTADGVGALQAVVGRRPLRWRAPSAVPAQSRASRRSPARGRCGWTGATALAPTGADRAGWAAGAGWAARCAVGGPEPGEAEGGWVWNAVTVAGPDLSTGAARNHAAGRLTGSSDEAPKPARYPAPPVPDPARRGQHGGGGRGGRMPPSW